MTEPMLESKKGVRARIPVLKRSATGHCSLLIETINSSLKLLESVSVKEDEASTRAQKTLPGSAAAATGISNRYSKDGFSSAAFSCAGCRLKSGAIGMNAYRRPASGSSRLSSLSSLA